MSDMTDIIVNQIKALTEQANAKATTIAAATTDRTKMVHDYLTAETPEDERIAEYQKWEEEALAKIEAAREQAAAYVAETYLKSVDEATVDGLKTEYKSLAEQVKTARKFYLLSIPGATEEDLKDVPALKTLRGGTSGSGGGGGKRPRINSISYRDGASGEWVEVSKQGKNAKDEDVTVTNFTVLAAALKDAFKVKVEVKDLQAAAFEAAGTDDLSSLNGKVIEFAYSVGEHTVFLKVQPKSDDSE